MIRRSPLLLVWALVVGACGGLTHPEPVPLGEPFWLHFGGTVVIPSSATTLRFAELIEDSRCPSDPLIHCAWAGRVRIRVAVSPAMAGVGSHELRFLDEPSATGVGGYVVRLLAIEPLAGLEPPPVSSYRAQFLITAVR